MDRGTKDRQPGCLSVKTDVKQLGFVGRAGVLSIVYEVGSSGPYFDGQYHQPHHATSILAKTGPDEYDESFGQAKLFTIDGTSSIYSQFVRIGRSG